MFKTTLCIIMLVGFLITTSILANQGDDEIKPILIEKTDFENDRSLLEPVLKGSQLKQSLIKGEVKVEGVTYIRVETKSEGIIDIVDDILAKKEKSSKHLYTNEHPRRSITTTNNNQAGPEFVHHNYVELTNFLNGTVLSTCPSIATLKTAGQSINGRELWYIKFSTRTDQSEPRPAFKYVGNMHGDEVVGREVLIHFIYLLCTSYGKEGTDDEKRITKLMNYADIVIMPSMNPDGYEHQPYAVRPNARGFDLNRNFPDQYKHPRVEDIVREKEVKLMMDFIRSEPFILSANLHGGALVANYPYDGDSSGTEGSGTYSKCPDDALFIHLANSYAKNHLKMFKSSEFKGGITNGAKWYRLYGGMQDWNYVYNSIPELTLELSNTKYPSADTLQQFWLDNKNALLTFAEQMYIGVKGYVVDTDYNAVPATIHIDNIAHDIKPFPAGDFYRLLAPGTYTMDVTARGYQSQKITLTIPENQQEPVIKMIILKRLNLNNPTSLTSAKEFFYRYVHFDVTYILIGVLSAIALGIIAITLVSCICFYIQKNK